MHRTTIINIAGSRVRSASHKLLYAASTFFLLMSTSAPGVLDRLIYGDWPGKPGDKVTEALNLLLIFTSLFLFWSGTRRTRTARVNRALPLALAAFLLISILWSVDPRVTLTQGTVYFFIVLGAIGLVEAFDGDGDALMDLVASICGLCAVASVLHRLIFLEPVDFIGIFPQKNVLGQVMAGGVLTALHGARIRGGRRLKYICIIALCTIVAFMSKSATSVLTIGVFFWLDILGRLYLRGGSARVVSICLMIVGVSIAIFLFVNPDLTFELMGKDQTLTGRTLFWPYVINYIMEKPILGWGYSAFWSPVNPLGLQIAEAIRGNNWFLNVIPNSHNGLLEALLGIGILGTSFFIFIWVRNFVMAIKCMTGPARQFGLSSVLLLIGILLIGVSEEVLLSPAQIWTNLFFMMGFICEKKLLLARARRRAMAASANRHSPASAHV